MLHTNSVKIGESHKNYKALKLESSDIHYDNLTLCEKLKRSICKMFIFIETSYSKLA